MSTAQKLLPWIILSLLVVVVAGNLWPRQRVVDGINLDRVGALAVSDEGRVKPLDTVARSSLLLFSGKQTVRDGEDRLQAIEWLLEVYSRSDRAFDLPVFRIDHPDLKAMLDVGADDRHMFSYRDLMPKLSEIDRQASMASQLTARQRDAFQRQILLLRHRVVTLNSLLAIEKPYMLPPQGDGVDWSPIAANPSDPVAVALRGILQGWQDRDPAVVAASVEAWNAEIAARHPGANERSRVEVWFSKASLFTLAASLYVVVFLIGCIGFFLGDTDSPLADRSPGGWGASMARSLVWATTLALVIHTLGLALRIYLQGRPPVTNLYSSAVFIGWATVPIGMFIDRRSVVRIGVVAASVIAFATLIVAHHLGGSGDTMQMMQAVLDSNFWLATHVVVITIGYSTTFLAGILGIAYVLLGVFTKRLEGERGRSLGRSIYGVVCFATLLSFVGTVLGGIWADQSWGRFWGWDPKENGAALIVLMNLIILHSRWAGLIRNRGVAILAIAGNIVTAWSWFGTNMLGVGLHSYGFTESAVFWILVFVLSQLALITIGLTPARRWRSGATIKPATA